MLPFITVKIQNRKVKTLVDTGCQQSVLISKLCDELHLVSTGPQRVVKMLNGESTRCCGEAVVDVTVHDQSIRTRCLVAPQLVCDAQMIIGMDIIRNIGGVYVGRGNQVWVGEQHCAAGVVKDDRKQWLEINESDFSAVFDGAKWTVEWKWENGEPELANGCSGYAIPEECKEEFEMEVRQWIDAGWLEEYSPDVHGRAEGVIPLMAARQPNKPKKVRPVMDYRELNGFIKSNPGVDVAVCQDKLRAWRKRGNRASMLDLKKAYLQIHVSERLQRFQLVKYRGRSYVMTRMGFGLSVAPKVMSKIITTVLTLDSRVAKGTDHYIDDIWVDESVVTAEEVRRLLLEYGLETKDPVPLTNARVLGLKVVKGQDGQYRWFRDGVVPSLEEASTKRELFSVFGKLTGHYPVAGWLRPACSYLKRQTNGIGWDEAVPVHVKVLADEVINKVSQHDPVTGSWSVIGASDGVVWCDASSLAVGCCLEVGGCIVEDATWLRKDDGSHINVAELEAVIKGLNMALRWDIAELRVITDSASVYGWVRSILEDSKRPKVSGLGEMVTKRRLGIIAQLIEEYGMNITIKLVPSASNKADVLTRVPQRWLRSQCLAMVMPHDEMKDRVQSVHAKHHLGVKRTLYLARKVCGDDVDEAMVQQIVDSCNMCRSVDPAPVKWDHGQLSVDGIWQRLAVDVAYVSKRPFLTLIDCGPSRFAIWRSLSNETAGAVVKELRRIFRERGAPDEVLCDNGPCFRSCETAKFLDEWGVAQVFCCAYKHSGNGIIERNHRTIKRMVARTGGTVEDMVYWYNNSPNCENRVPASTVYQYEARLPGAPKAPRPLEDLRGAKSSPYQAGDVVFVKPRNARSDTVWKRATVTGVVAENVVEVDGMNRHVADVRQAGDTTPATQIRHRAVVPGVAVEYDGGDDEDEPCGDHDADGVENDVGSTHSIEGGRNSDSENDSTEPSPRDRRPPQWLSDYILH